MDRRFARRHVGRSLLAGAVGALAANLPMAGLAAPPRPVRLAQLTQTTWYFAEGQTTPGWDEYLTIANPGPGSANVTVTYYLTTWNPNAQRFDLSTVTKTLAVGVGRKTISVHYYSAVDPDPIRRLGLGRGWPLVSAVIQSDRGIVVERPMYFEYGPGIDGGHVVLGADQPRTEWYFAEGWTGTGFDMYLTIQNPNGQAAQVHLTYILANGSTQTKYVTAPANQRRTVTVHETAEGVGRNQAVSVIVESTNGVPIVVERPMYFNYVGGDVTGAIDATGGHVAVGYPL